MYSSKSLSNVTGMAEGARPWSTHLNDLWHWFKHAQPFLTELGVREAEIEDVPTEEAYVALGAAIAAYAAKGGAGSEVRVREGHRGSLVWNQYLVWFAPVGAPAGVFLVVNDRGDYGELVTLFPPDDGYTYFERQAAETIQ